VKLGDLKNRVNQKIIMMGTVEEKIIAQEKASKQVQLIESDVFFPTKNKQKMLLIYFFVFMLYCCICYGVLLCLEKLFKCFFFLFFHSLLFCYDSLTKIKTVTARSSADRRGSQRPKKRRYSWGTSQCRGICWWCA